MGPECLQGQCGAPEAEARHGGVFVGAPAGGAARSAKDRDRAYRGRYGAGDPERGCHAVREQPHRERLVGFERG